MRRPAAARVGTPASARASARPIREVLVALAAYAGMWVVAVIAHYAYTAVGPASLPRLREISVIVFFFASLLCCLIAAPWMIRPVARPLSIARAGGGSGWLLGRIAVVAALGGALLALFLPNGVAAGLQRLFSAPKLLVPALVLSAIAEEVFFREALPSAIWDYAQRAMKRESLISAAVCSLVVSQGLCSLGHLSPAAGLLHATSAIWRNVAWVVGSNFVFGSLMLINWWIGTGSAERVVLHTFANLAIVLAPTGVADGVRRSAMFCAIGLVTSTVVLLYRRPVPGRLLAPR